MIFYNKQINISPSNFYLEDFIQKSLESSLELTKKEICLSNAIINDDKSKFLENINISNCYFCLACVEKQDLIKQNDFELVKDLKKKNLKTIFFNNMYNKNSFPKNFVEYYSKYEVKRCSPLACNFLFKITNDKKNTYFRSDPYGSLNIKTVQDPRDGKLDIVVFNRVQNKLLILETKKDLKSLLNDKKRDQWNKYKSEIDRISKIYNLKTKYLVLIAGNEEELYPKNTINIEPIYDQRERFYDYIKDKKFLSLSFLYALNFYNIFVKKIFWEDIFFDNNYLGYLSAGCVDKDFKIRQLII